MRSFHLPDDFPPRSVCFPMASPLSTTYTPYSVPSPYSSGSSASLPNGSPISQPFDSIPGSQHNTGVVTDYVGYAPPSSSLPGYADMAYTANTAQNYGYNMNWSAPDSSIPAKRQPASSSSHPPQQYQQYSYYQQTPSQTLTNETKTLITLYAPPSPHYRPQQHEQRSLPVIHSPVPKPASSHDTPSLFAQVNTQCMQPPQRGNQLPIQNDALFDIDIDERHSSAQSARRRHFQPIYSHSSPHSVPTLHGYPFPPRAQDFTVSRQQLQNQRGIGSDFPSCDPNSSTATRQEDSGVRTYPQALAPPQHPTRFDMPPPNQGNLHSHVDSPNLPSSPLPVPYYSSGGQNREQIQRSTLYPEQQAYAIQPAALCPPNVSLSGFDVSSPPEVRYSSDEAQYDMPEERYSGASVASSYADVCGPRFANCEGEEIREHRIDGVVENGWSSSAGGGMPMYIGDGRMNWEEINPDADAEGDDDLEGFGSPDQQGDRTFQLRRSPDSPGDYQLQSELAPEGDDGEDGDEEIESEEDDGRDPEFVARRAYSTSYPFTEGRNLRSTRFNPYPSVSPTLPSSSVHELELQEQEQYQRQGQQLRSRRSYSHSTSSPISEPYTPVAVDGSPSTRRRARPSANVPFPVPVPNLTKKSRGRRVPTMEEFRAEAAASVKSGNNRKKSATTPSNKASRTYTCDVDGCGKLFARGEHLKRHVRSIHTYEKRQPPPIFFSLDVFANM